MRKILIIAFGLILINNISAQTDAKYSSDELIEDLDYMYTTLKESHFNLFVNTTESGQVR